MTRQRYGWGKRARGLASAAGLTIAFGAVALGCAATPEPVTPAQVAPAEPPAPPPLRPLTLEEELLSKELKDDATALGELGPRSLAHSWNLHSATDHLARKLEVLGYEVQRQGFPVGEEILQNLEVVVPGARSPESLVIAAHYDTAAESPGANASSSGAVVLLALARELRGKRFARGVRLVWLSDESGSDGTPGSAVYTQTTQRRRVQVAATLTLGSLGNYSLDPGSQRYPDELLYGSDARTPFGNFIGVLSNTSSFDLLEHVRPALSASSLPVEELVLPDQAPLAAEGPQARFWQAGLRGLLLTDTAQFRTPHADGTSDTLDKLDFDRLARVARLLNTLVASLAGPAGAPPTPVPGSTASGSPAPADAAQPDAAQPDAAQPGEPPAASAPGDLMPPLPPLPPPAPKPVPPPG